MKPLTLRVAGLNSFVEEQVIDFETLTSRGLFGIFGPTGSGKSTILDAMTLALYDKIPRQTNEYINQDVSKMHISFTFSVYSQKGETIYVVERSYKKKENSAPIKDARLYEKESKIVLADKLREVNETIEALIGMNYKDFSCSVVLPQGKFSQFLTLKGTDRAKMLENIFHLEKFGKDLEEKLKQRRDKSNALLQEKRAQLGVYATITEEELEQKTNKLKKQTDTLRILQEKVKQAEKKFQQDNTLFEYLQQWNQNETKREELYEKKVIYETLQQQLQQSQKAEMVSQYITQFEKSKVLFQQKKQQSDILNIEVKKAEEKTAIYEKKYPYFEKENILVELAKKEQTLKQAKVWQEEVVLWEKEANRLQKDIFLVSQAIKEIEEEIKQYQKTKEELENQYLEQKKLLQQKKISPQQREQIQKGAELEKEILQQQKDKIILFEKKQKQLQLQKQSKEALTNILQKEQQIKQTKKEIEQNKENLPKEPSPSLLLFMQQELTKAEAEAENVKKQYEQIQEMTEKIEIQKQKFSEINRLLQIQRQHLQQSKIELEEKNKQLEAWEKNNMAAVLAAFLQEGCPCPVCGSTNHPKKAVSHMTEEFSQKLQQQIQQQKQLCDEWEQRVHHNHMQCSILEKEIEASVQKKQECIKQLNGITLEQAQQKTATAQQNLQKESEKQFQHKQQKEVLEKQFSDITEQFSLLLQKKAVEQTNIENSTNQITLFLKEENQLEKAEKENIEVLQQMKKVVLLQSEETFLQKYNAIIVLEKEKTQLEQQLEQKEKQLNQIVKNITLLQQQQQEKEMQKISFNAQKQEKMQNIQKQKQDIVSVAEDYILEEYLEDIQQYEKAATEAEEIKRQQKEALKETKNQNEIYMQNQKDLYLALEQYHFQTIEHAKNALLTQQQKETKQSQIKKYEEVWQRVHTKREELKEKIQNTTITQEQLQQQKQILENMQNQKETLLQQNAVLSSEVEQIQKNMQKAEKYKKELQNLEKEANVIESLSKVLKGRNFMKYLANRQLQYITEEASKRLGQITNHRYELLADGVEFQIKDNASGGSIRATETLSGGEVFLTSFALALALSSKIQMKNTAPLEFFFLDEGFGTLDSNLIDVVMSSLERLYEQRLHVGLISHVEELKERIAMRLIVTAAKPKIEGSKVTLESI